MATNFERKNVINNEMELTITADGQEPKVVKYDLRDKAPAFGSLDECRQYQATVKATVSTLCDAWKTANAQNDGLTGKIASDIKALCNLYNEAALTDVLTVCCENKENPLLKAVEVDTYTTIMAAERSEKGNSSVKIFKMTEKKKRIPIDVLHKVVEGGIGLDKSWYHEIQAVNKLFAAKAKVKHTPGANVADVLRSMDSYRMDEEAKKYENGENPLSNRKLLEAVRTLVTKMIGEEYARKCLSYDITRIQDTYLKEDNNDASGLSLKAAGHKKFYDLFLIVCNHLYTGNPYKINW